MQSKLIELPSEIVTSSDITPYTELKPGIFNLPFYHNGSPSMSIADIVHYSDGDFKTVTYIYKATEGMAEAVLAEREVVVYRCSSPTFSGGMITEYRDIYLPTGIKISNSLEYSKGNSLPNFKFSIETTSQRYPEYHADVSKLVGKAGISLFLKSGERIAAQVKLNRRQQISPNPELFFAETRDRWVLQDIMHLLQEDRNPTDSEMAALEVVYQAAIAGNLLGWTDTSIYEAFEDGFRPHIKA